MKIRFVIKKFKIKKIDDYNLLSIVSLQVPIDPRRVFLVLSFALCHTLYIHVYIFTSYVYYSVHVNHLRESRYNLYKSIIFYSFKMSNFIEKKKTKKWSAKIACFSQCFQAFYFRPFLLIECIFYFFLNLKN